MAPSLVARPENVLKRTDSLLSLGQTATALSHISSIFNSKKFRTTPISTLEPILLKFLDLCVILKKGRLAKEGLHAYKNVAQNVSTASVETIIKHFLNKSEERLKEATNAFLAANPPSETSAPAAAADGTLPEAAVEVEDLDSPQTPESLLMGTVSEDKDTDRDYRNQVMPWMRFCWEGYRNCLDVLRNNNRLEGIYLTVALRALRFLLDNKRRVEFRRLSDILRSHLSSALKYQNQTHSLDFSETETLSKLVEIRFGMLDGALEEGMEMWAEGYRIGEDLWALLEKGGATNIHGPKGKDGEKEVKTSASTTIDSLPSSTNLLITFYSKMSKIFLVGENMLFHSTCFAKIFEILKSAGGGEKIEKELDELAPLVLVSALAVPNYLNTADGADGKKGGKNVGLVGLGGEVGNLTRERLLKEASSRLVMKRVPSALVEAYKLLESKDQFNPLTLASRLSPILDSISSNPKLAPYVPHLKRVAVIKLFQELAQIYKVIKLSKVFKLANLSNGAEGAEKEIEALLIYSSKRGDIKIIIDHSSDEVRFEESAYSQDPLPNSTTVPFRTRLTHFAVTLEETVNTVYPDDCPLSLLAAGRSKAFEALDTQVAADRLTIQNRKKMIARRKEVVEELAARRATEEAHNRAVAARLRAEQEAKAAKEALRKAEVERAKKTVENIRKQDVKALVDNLDKAGIKIENVVCFLVA
ncbi:hypothetical protein BT69DRAFT_740272 [Atractiella rhizophila]|nr:hypothetical protein BT69DRAFT_740272 [Atractiella rhizophila]